MRGTIKAETLDTPTESRDPHGRGCWYMRYIKLCPICGRGEEWLQRQWSPRPERAEDRIEIWEAWDYCDVF